MDSKNLVMNIIALNQLYSRLSAYLRTTIGVLQAYLPTILRIASSVSLGLVALR